MNDLREPFDEAALDTEIQAIIKRLKSEGASKAYICERSFDIEDEAREALKTKAFNLKP